MKYHILSFDCSDIVYVGHIDCFVQDRFLFLCLTRGKKRILEAVVSSKL